MENPSHYISIVMSMGKEKRIAPPKARTSPSANRWLAPPAASADAEALGQSIEYP
jgi:hypothetical protein